VNEWLDTFAAFYCRLCKRIGKDRICSWCGVPCDDVHFEI
jgi:hypothetical protein